jgi:ABC-2 type transport system permease protein
LTLRYLLRVAGALFQRDLGITRSYRAAFFVEIIQTLFAVAAFYFLASFVQSEEVARALPQGDSYFAFAIIGIAFFDFLTLSMLTFEVALEEARQNGALEPLMVSQTPFALILLGSAVYPYVMMTLRSAIWIGWAIVAFDFPFRGANWLGAALVLLASVLAFVGLGIISVGYTMLYKRGNPVRWAFLGIAGLVSGILYPVSVLPETLQFVARLIPVTYSLAGMRAALLDGAGIAELWPSLRALLIFAALILPVSIVVFGWAVRRTKIIGTLTHF